MLYKIFYSILVGMSPWTATISLPTMLAKSTQVEVIENAGDFSSYVQKEKESRAAIDKWAKSNEDVLRQFDLFCDSLKKGVREGKISEEDAVAVLGAASFAAEKHKAQVRSNPKKTPYIIHPIEVADLIMRVGKVYNKDVVVAAILHDSLDETGTSLGEIATVYGEKVSKYVNEMTNKKELSLKEQKKAQIMQAFHQTPEVAIIKLSDKLSNLATLAQSPPPSWSRDRIDQYFQWAQSVVENLPEANPSLKQEVKKVISDYWARQAEIKKIS